MPKPANPLATIAKKLDALKIKSEKLAKEISELSSLVTAEASKDQTAEPVSKKIVAKKAQATVTTEPKKRGRPPKALKVETTIARPTAVKKAKAKGKK